ncbi:COP9 signalosome complex subunit 7 isoform X1 [Pyrus x bretschneideri]|uniref:COP9 signalosome complex subunit 7 isoform X1 n=1 Tax=Pyrus x bretschneideri TaxID=225117 RepID=UPI00202F6768|nr:COP9 signalosome complex subunit 7 isoform X1 [Pyrus x bretschneideri]
MEIEQKQEEVIDHYVKQASSLDGSALGPLVAEVTSHPALFAFSEIIAVPNVLQVPMFLYIYCGISVFCVYFGRVVSAFEQRMYNQNFVAAKEKIKFLIVTGLCFIRICFLTLEYVQLEGTENSVYLDVLRLFAHGTWSDYKSDASRRPQLVPDQVLKLKQLTVLTLAETNKVLPYHQLMQELDVINVRELEDFLINECMYVGILRGKLDQLRKCFEVQFAAGRDPRPGQLGSMIQTLSNWLDTSSNLLISIQEKMKWADTMTEVAKEHKKEVGNTVEEVKKSISIKADIDFRGHGEIYSEPGGVMDYEEDRSRPKRRRHPICKS